MADENTYTESEISERLSGPLASWSYVDGQLQRQVKTVDWRSAMLVANGISLLAELAWHHPDLSVSWGAVVIGLSTHSAGGITDKDFELAARIEDMLAARGGGALEGTPAETPWRLLDD